MSNVSNYFRWVRTIGLISLMGAAFGLIQAQKPDPAAMASQYAATAKQNAQLMRQYTWQMRTELTLKGEPKPAQLYQMRFDADGKPQKTLISAPVEQDKKRGIRGRIRENKIEEFKDWAGELSELVKDYLAPTPGTMMDFYSKAAYAHAPDGSVQVSSTNFLNKGDKATFWLDPNTQIPIRFTFETVLDKDAVSGQVDFAQVAGGPQYASRVTINVPSKEVTSKIENFNYQKQ